MRSYYSTRKVISQDVCRNTPPWFTVGTHTHAIFHILWHCDREGISTVHTHTVQDQGQLPASIFIIFILPDLLLPSWRQWSQPSPCDASNLLTHTHIHTCSCTLGSPSTDNWDQLLQGASSLDPAPPPLHLILLLHLPSWQKAIPKPPPSPPFPFSLTPPPSCMPVSVFATSISANW